jgi:hypothetical protein
VRYLNSSLLIILALAGCKKGPKSSLPVLPDANLRPAGDVVDTPQSTVLDTCYRYSGHAGQALAFYKPLVGEARQTNDSLDDGNWNTSGGLCREGTATPKDASKHSVLVRVNETSDSTTVDVWENIPKT